MRKTVAGTKKISMKDIVKYLTEQVGEKERYLNSVKSELQRGSNPSLRENYIKAEAVKDWAEYLLMAIKTNSPHYLK